MKKPNPALAGEQSRRHHAIRKDNIALKNGHVRLVYSRPEEPDPVPTEIPAPPKMERKGIFSRGQLPERKSIFRGSSLGSALKALLGWGRR